MLLILIQSTAARNHMYMEISRYQNVIFLESIKPEIFLKTKQHKITRLRNKDLSSSLDVHHPVCPWYADETFAYVFDAPAENVPIAAMPSAYPWRCAAVPSSV